MATPEPRKAPKARSKSWQLVGDYQARTSLICTAVPVPSMCQNRRKSETLTCTRTTTKPAQTSIAAVDS
jgi:hypothetical protein